MSPISNESVKDTTLQDEVPVKIITPTLPKVPDEKEVIRSPLSLSPVRSNKGKSASICDSPSREVTLVDDATRIDPRKRRPSDLKDLVVRVSDRRPQETASVTNTHKAPLRSVETTTTPTSIPRDVPQDPRLSAFGEDFSSDGRPPKRSRYAEYGERSINVLKKVNDLGEENKEIVQDFRRPNRKSFDSDKSKKDDGRQLDPRQRKLEESRSKDLDQMDSFSSPPGTPVRDENDETPVAPPVHVVAKRIPMNLPLPLFANKFRKVNPIATLPSTLGLLPNSPNSYSLKSPLSTASNCSGHISFSKVISAAIVSDLQIDSSSMLLTSNKKEEQPTIPKADVASNPLELLSSKNNDTDDQTDTDTPVSPGSPLAGLKPGEDAHKEGDELYERTKMLLEKFDKYDRKLSDKERNLQAKEILSEKAKKKLDSSKFLKGIDELRRSPSNIINSMRLRNSIFDDDSLRLSNIHQKYEPKIYDAISEDGETPPITKSELCKDNTPDSEPSKLSFISSTITDVPTVIASEITNSKNLPAPQIKDKMDKSEPICTSSIGNNLQDIRSVPVTKSRTPDNSNLSATSLISPVIPISMADIIAATTPPIPSATPINSLPGFKPSMSVTGRSICERRRNLSKSDYPEKDLVISNPGLFSPNNSDVISSPREISCPELLASPISMSSLSSASPIYGGNHHSSKNISSPKSQPSFTCKDNVLDVEMDSNNSQLIEGCSSPQNIAEIVEFNSIKHRRNSIDSDGKPENAKKRNSLKLNHSKSQFVDINKNQSKICDDPELMSFKYDEIPMRSPCDTDSMGSPRTDVSISVIRKRRRTSSDDTRNVESKQVDSLKNKKQRLNSGSLSLDRKSVKNEKESDHIKELKYDCENEVKTNSFDEQKPIVPKYIKETKKCMKSEAEFKDKRKEKQESSESRGRSRKHSGKSNERSDDRNIKKDVDADIPYDVKCNSLVDKHVKSEPVLIEKTKSPIVDIKYDISDSPSKPKEVRRVHKEEFCKDPNTMDEPKKNKLSNVKNLIKVPSKEFNIYTSEKPKYVDKNDSLSNNVCNKNYYHDQKNKKNKERSDSLNEEIHYNQPKIDLLIDPSYMDSISDSDSLDDRDVRSTMSKSSRANKTKKKDRNNSKLLSDRNQELKDILSRKNNVHIDPDVQCDISKENYEDRVNSLTYITEDQLHSKFNHDDIKTQQKKNKSRERLHSSRSESEDFITSSDEERTLFKEPEIDTRFDMYDKVKSRHLKMEQKREELRMKQDKERMMLQFRKQQRLQKKKSSSTSSASVVDSDTDTNDENIKACVVKRKRKITTSSEEDKKSHMSTDESADNKSEKRRETDKIKRKQSKSQRKRPAKENKPLRNLVSDISSDDSILNRSEENIEPDRHRKMIKTPKLIATSEIMKSPRPVKEREHNLKENNDPKMAIHKTLIRAENIYSSEESDSPLVEVIQPYAKPVQPYAKPEVIAATSDDLEIDSETKTERSDRLQAIFGDVSDDSDSSEPHILRSPNLSNMQKSRLEKLPIRSALSNSISPSQKYDSSHIKIFDCDKDLGSSKHTKVILNDEIFEATTPASDSGKGSSATNSCSSSTSSNGSDEHVVVEQNEVSIAPVLSDQELVIDSDHQDESDSKETKRKLSTSEAIKSSSTDDMCTDEVYEDPKQVCTEISSNKDNIEKSSNDDPEITYEKPIRRISGEDKEERHSSFTGEEVACEQKERGPDMPSLFDLTGEDDVVITSLSSDIVKLTPASPTVINSDLIIKPIADTLAEQQLDMPVAVPINNVVKPNLKSQASRSVITQEETLNAVAGLLASYDNYKADTTEPEEELVASDPCNVGEDLEEAHEAAQLIQSELPTGSREPDGVWDENVAPVPKLVVNTSVNSVQLSGSRGSEILTSRSNMQIVEDQVQKMTEKRVIIKPPHMVSSVASDKRIIVHSGPRINPIQEQISISPVKYGKVSDKIIIQPNEIIPKSVENIPRILSNLEPIKSHASAWNETATNVISQAIKDQAISPSQIQTSTVGSAIAVTEPEQKCSPTVSLEISTESTKENIHESAHASEVLKPLDHASSISAPKPDIKDERSAFVFPNWSEKKDAEIETKIPAMDVLEELLDSTRDEVANTISPSERNEVKNEDKIVTASELIKKLEASKVDSVKLETPTKTDNDLDSVHKATIKLSAVDANENKLEIHGVNDDEKSIPLKVEMIDQISIENKCFSPRKLDEKRETSLLKNEDQKSVVFDKVTIDSINIDNAEIKQEEENIPVTKPLISTTTTSSMILDTKEDVIKSEVKKVDFEVQPLIYDDKEDSPIENSVEQNLGDNHSLEQQELIKHHSMVDKLVGHNSIEEKSVENLSTEENLVENHAIEQKLVDPNCTEEKLFEHDSIKPKSVEYVSNEQKSVEHHSIEPTLIEHDSIEQELVEHSVISENEPESVHVHKTIDSTSSVPESNFVANNSANEDFADIDDNPHPAVKESLVIYSSPRGRGRGSRGKRGHRGGAIKVLNFEMPLDDVKTTRKSQRGRNPLCRQPPTSFEDDTLELRRSSRPKRARRHPDMVEHEDTSNRRRRGSRLGRGSVRVPPQLDVFDFHESDDDAAVMAQARKTAEASSAETTDSATEEDTAASLAATRKSKRLQDKVVEDDEQEQQQLLVPPITISTTSVRGKFVRGVEPSVQRRTVTAVRPGRTLTITNAPVPVPKTDVEVTSAAHPIVKPLGLIISNNSIHTSSVLSPITPVPPTNEEPIQSPKSVMRVLPNSARIVCAANSPNSAVGSSSPNPSSSVVVPADQTLTPLVDPVTGVLTPMTLVNEEGKYIPVSDESPVSYISLTSSSSSQPASLQTCSVVSTVMTTCVPSGLIISPSQPTTVMSPSQPTTMLLPAQKSLPTTQRAVSQSISMAKVPMLNSSANLPGKASVYITANPAQSVKGPIFTTTKNNQSGVKTTVYLNTSGNQTVSVNKNPICVSTTAGQITSSGKAPIYLPSASAQTLTGAKTPIYIASTSGNQTLITDKIYLASTGNHSLASGKTPIVFNTGGSKIGSGPTTLVVNPASRSSMVQPRISQTSQGPIIVGNRQQVVSHASQNSRGDLLVTNQSPTGIVPARASLQSQGMIMSHSTTQPQHTLMNRNGVSVTPAKRPDLIISPSYKSSNAQVGGSQKGNFYHRVVTTPSITLTSVRKDPTTSVATNLELLRKQPHQIQQGNFSPNSRNVISPAVVSTTIPQIRPKTNQTVQITPVGRSSRHISTTYQVGQSPNVDQPLLLVSQPVNKQSPSNINLKISNVHPSPPPPAHKSSVLIPQQAEALVLNTNSPGLLQTTPYDVINPKNSPHHMVAYDVLTSKSSPSPLQIAYDTSSSGGKSSPALPQVAPYDMSYNPHQSYHRANTPQPPQVYLRPQIEFAGKEVYGRPIEITGQGKEVYSLPINIATNDKEVYARQLDGSEKEVYARQLDIATVEKGVDSRAPFVVVRGHAASPLERNTASPQVRLFTHEFKKNCS